MRPLSRLHLVLICCSITANAICAGGIYTFPLISPALVDRMKLSQPQVSTVMLAAMIGQYATAAPVGKILDRYGPWSCSFVASFMFAIGYGMFAWEFARTPEDTQYPSPSAFPHLVLYFGLLGLGTIFSYFALVFAAMRTFSRYIGFATGTSLALFGTSPLVLSTVATKFFTSPAAGVDVSRFFGFMAILTGVVNLFGALILPGPQTDAIIATPTMQEDTLEHDDEDVEEVGEESRLLARSAKSHIDATVVPAPEPDHLTAIGLMKDPYFWVLALSATLVVGAAEMIKSNIGLIVLSLPSSSISQDISAQVQIIAISDTATRLLVGPVADFVSPVATWSPSGIWAFPRKPLVTRIMFYTGASLLFAITFLWQIAAARSQGALWPLSICTGIANGTIFTLLPSILGSLWGSPNQGRNFGLMSYTCFFATTAFSYLYAFVADSHTPLHEGICRGVQCWRLTFWLSAGAMLVSAGLSILLWKKWRMRV